MHDSGIKNNSRYLDFFLIICPSNLIESQDSVVKTLTKMAYRGVKGSDPFVSKTSRNERFAQMSKQEQIIQQKKMEIQAKMQEQKAKEAVENMKKSNSSASTTTISKGTVPK